MKKRMSLYEEQIHKPPLPEAMTKRASIHDLPSLPPVPKPRCSVASSGEESSKSQKEDTLKDVIEEFPTTIQSEYMASFKDPSQIKHETSPPLDTHNKSPQKSESIDSEKEFITKYGVLEAYENIGYQSDSQEDTFDTDAEIIDHTIPQIKQRQMSMVHPPVAAARKTIFERSVSLPGEDLQEVSEQSVKARKRFFEQQIKNEMVIDQLMTQLDEEPVPEVKTLSHDIQEEHKTAISSAPELVSKIELPNTRLAPKPEKFSPTSSSSQDTKTEDDITQDTPTSVKDLAKCFQSARDADKFEYDRSQELIVESTAAESEQFESSLTESSEDIKKQIYGEVESSKDLRDDIEPKSEVKSTTESVEQEKSVKQLSTESDQSISSERSLELGSMGDVPVHLADGLLYKSESMSRPSDSLEVHVDKSETEDSEKITDGDQDFTSKSHSFEIRSFGSMEHTPEITLDTKDDRSSLKEKRIVSPINQSREQIPDTVWEVVQTQQISESVTEIPVEKQLTVEKDDDFSGSVRDESDLGSEIHQDHSESSYQFNRSEGHSDVEKLILESLYHQKIHPDEAKKIAAELIDDIESEIEKRHSRSDELESEPPAPHPDVAKNQISEYLRQLADSKGLDEREVQLVESVLARKHSELSRLSRRDTQTSSMEITDEDLKYSGAECDLSPYESEDNVLEEQMEYSESEKSDTREKSDKAHGDNTFVEKTSEFLTKDTHFERDEETYEGDQTLKYKSELEDKLHIHDDVVTTKSYEQFAHGAETSEETIGKSRRREDIEAHEEIQVYSDNLVSKQVSSTKLSDDEEQDRIKTVKSTELVTDSSMTRKTEMDDSEKSKVQLGGVFDSESCISEKIEGGVKDTKNIEKITVSKNLDEQLDKNVQKLEEMKVTDDGTIITTSEVIEKTSKKTQSVSEVVDQQFKETVTVIEKVIDFDQGVLPLEADQDQGFVTKSYIETIKHDKLKQTLSDESKSSQDESMKSPEEKSSSSSAKREESENQRLGDKPDVIFRKSKLHKEFDSSSSSGNLKADRKSGADFETYSSSGESHYHSFEDSARSRPCSSDIEGLLAAGSSEYESALTSQDMSSRSHLTSAEYHTAVSSLSSRDSMKSLDTESSGNLASIEVSEASETLVPSTFEMDGDILDGGQLLEDEVADIRIDHESDDFMAKAKASFDSEDHGGSMDISEDDKPTLDELTFKMKRSQEMTFQPEPRVIIADSPQSENALEMDERFGTSLEDGSVLSMSLSSTSELAATRTVIELSRRDSDKVDASLTVSGASGQLSLEDSDHLAHGNLESLTASNTSLDIKTGIDISTSTIPPLDSSIGSVTITTSTIDENGTQSVSTQVTSQAQVSEIEQKSTEKQQTTYKDVDESTETTKKIRGHRRNESTSFTPSMISGFSTKSEGMKHDYLAESDKYHEMSLKEVQYDEMKDVDETEKEENYDTEADQDYFKQQREAQFLEEEEYDQEEEFELPDKNQLDSRPQSEVFSEDRPDSELVELMQQPSSDVFNEPIERPDSPEPCEEYEIKEEDIEAEELYKQLGKHIDARGLINDIESEPKIGEDIKEATRTSGVLSEKSSFEEAEAEAAFSMVAHISPAHKAKPICPILEDEDAEKHELETRERAQKEMERRRAQIMKDASPGSIPDITVTQHMTPLQDRGFHYPDLELEEKEEELAKSTPQTPASASSKSSEETDQGREYVLDEAHATILEEPEVEDIAEKPKEIKDKEVKPVTQIVETKKKDETGSAADSPNSDSFELLEKPDIIDDFVVIEEVAKEAEEGDAEGKSLHITEQKYIRKHDEEVEEYLVRSAPTPLTRMTELKYYPDGSSSDEVGPFDFEDSPPQAGKKDNNARTEEGTYEYDRELEASKKWIEMQFQGDQASMMAAGYGYEMEFERGPLEDIKEEEATDFDPSSSRIGSLESQKQSGGSLGSVKDSFSSTPEYDVLAGRKFFTRSGEHDDVSMSSLQEFEHLERAISLENRRYHQGSQDSSSNGSFTRRYHANRSGQGDDISLSSLKEFEGLESACIAAHTIEVKAKEEEALLAQIDEAQENVLSEVSESLKTDSKETHEKEEEDYEKRMFEIDEIIRQAQSNVEKFIDLGDKEESIGRGDSLEEVAKVPDLELDEPLQKKAATAVNWTKDDPMQTSIDSLDQKKPHHESTDSLDTKKTEMDIMTASTDSIEFQAQSHKSAKDTIMTDSIEIQDQDSKSFMINSDSLELNTGTQGNLTALSDSIDEDGSRIGDPMGLDQSSSSGRGDDFSSSGREEAPEPGSRIQHQCAEFLIGSTDSLDPTSSTATHATYQYETDSVMSGSFTSGGSNTMVSSTDTIDPMASKACGVDLAAAVRKVWFDDDTFESGKGFTTEILDDGSKPFVTEVIEPCEDDPNFSHTIHRRVEMPPEIKKITFRGPDADQQLRQYVENFGEGEDVQESEERDKDGNVHVKRVVQKRFIVKSDTDGSEKRLSGPELEAYLQQVSVMQGDFDLRYKETDSGHDRYYHQEGSRTSDQTFSRVDYQQGRM